jgi:site-specific recombinase XerD
LQYSPHNADNAIKLSHTIEVYLTSKEIAGFNPNTFRNFRLTLSRLSDYLKPDDPELNRITTNEIGGFLYKLQTQPLEAEYLIPRERKHLSPKSIRSVHANTSSFWGWAVKEGFVDKNIAHTIDPPNPKPTVIEPFDKKDIRALLQTVGNGSESALRSRDKAIILFLLDSGVRAPELCNLKIAEVDVREGSAIVQGKGRLNSGKGN